MKRERRLVFAVEEKRGHHKQVVRLKEEKSELPEVAGG
jgi:hypothetical protein